MKIFTLIAAINFVCFGAFAQTDTTKNQRVLNYEFDSTVYELPTNPPIFPRESQEQMGDKPMKLTLVHGMTGNYASWASVNAHILQNYKGVDTDLADWSKAQFSTALAGAGVLISQMDYQKDPTFKHGIFAHSAGGIITRTAVKIQEDKGESLPIDFLVTFQTPNLGAIAAENKVKHVEKYKSFFNNTCKDLSAGPVLEFVQSTTLGKVIGGAASIFDIDITKEATEWVCEKATGVVFFVAEQKFSVPIEEALVPNNPSLQYIADAPSVKSDFVSLPVYSIARDDEDMMFFNFVYESVNNPQLYPELMKCDAMYDSAKVFVNKTRNHYEAKSLLWKSRAKRFPFGNWFGWRPFNQPLKVISKYYTQGMMYDLSNEWGRGVKWFDSANDQYKTLIGALQFEAVATECYCECPGSTPYEPIVIYPVDCNQTNNCAEYTNNGMFASECFYRVNETVLRKETPSDALVLAPSAIGMPNATYPAELITGPSHFGVRNHSTTAKFLKQRLFSGAIDPVFKLKSK